MATHEFDGYDKMVHGWAQSAARENLPRQAFVVRPDGMGAVVQFSDGSHAVLPATHAGLPVGTRGWVIPTHGDKGLFVADGIIANPTKTSASEFSNQTLSSAGTFLGASPEMWSGLILSRTYRIDWTTSIRYFSGDSGQHRLSCQIVGATTDTRTSGNIYQSPGAAGSNIHVATTYMTPDENGNISFTPAIVWNSGTTIFSRVSTTATIS